VEPDQLDAARRPLRLTGAQRLNSRESETALESKSRLRDGSPAGHAETEVFLTEQELAGRHQRSVRTIRNLRVSGGYIPFVKIGRHVRYRLSDVIAYEKANLRRSTSDEGGP
jgi:hypothetical protein